MDVKNNPAKIQKYKNGKPNITGSILLYNGKHTTMTTNGTTNPIIKVGILFFIKFSPFYDNFMQLISATDQKSFNCF
jgi:hypothetical protein